MNGGQLFTSDAFQQGHRNWALRPDDEGFDDINPLISKLETRKALSHEMELNFPAIAQHGSIVANEGEVELIQPSGQRFQFTPWGFRALCKRIGAHTEFLKKLPAENVAADLSVLLNDRNGLEGGPASWDKDQKVLTVRESSGLHRIRHIGSERYGRIYDIDVATWVKSHLMERFGFTVPPTWDDRPRGLYAGDEDVFFFLQDETKAIEVKRPDGKTEVLKRGLMAWNSEVGKKTFGLCSFLYQMICGNHIIWGAEQVSTMETRHVGNAMERATVDIMPGVSAYLESGTSKETDLLTKAMRVRVAENGPEAVRILRTKDFSKGVAMDAVVLAATDPTNEGLDPLSYMAIVNGLTLKARAIVNGDARTALELKATNLLQSIAA